jgi:hypothetical protein
MGAIETTLLMFAIVMLAAGSLLIISGVHERSHGIREQVGVGRIAIGSTMIGITAFGGLLAVVLAFLAEMFRNVGA